MLNNQKGTLAFEAVLVIITLTAIGAAGYFAFQARSDKTDYSVHVPTHKATPTPTPASTALITEKIAAVHMSFLRRSTWTITRSGSDNDQLIDVRNGSGFRVLFNVVQPGSFTAQHLGACGECGNFNTLVATVPLGSQTPSLIDETAPAGLYTGTYMSSCRDKKCLVKSPSTGVFLDATVDYDPAFKGTAETATGGSSDPFNSTDINYRAALQIVQSLRED